MDITLTSEAEQRIDTILIEENRKLLRLYVSGGGCSGLQYGFEFADAEEDNDFVFEQNEVKLIIDPISYQYVQGIIIDYAEGLMGARFTIENPNAQMTCGCGSSFAI